MQQEKTIKVIGEINPNIAGFAIKLDSHYAQGLTGLQGFSHAVVLWWASETDSEELRDMMIYKKPYRNNPNDIGVFGSRSPSRPNPIGMSIVGIKTVDVENATIITPYIDTVPGTPVIDIKPYFPASDRVRDAISPEWCNHWPRYLEDAAEFDWENEFE